MSAVHPGGGVCGSVGGVDELTPEHWPLMAAPSKKLSPCFGCPKRLLDETIRADFAGTSLGAQIDEPRRNVTGSAAAPCSPMP